MKAQLQPPNNHNSKPSAAAVAPATAVAAAGAIVTPNPTTAVTATAATTTVTTTKLSPSTTHKDNKNKKKKEPPLLTGVVQALGRKTRQRLDQARAQRKEIVRLDIQAAPKPPPPQATAKVTATATTRPRKRPRNGATVGTTADAADVYDDDDKDEDDDEAKIAKKNPHSTTTAAPQPLALPSSCTVMVSGFNARTATVMHVKRFFKGLLVLRIFILPFAASTTTTTFRHNHKRNKSISDGGDDLFRVWVELATPAAAALAVQRSGESLEIPIRSEQDDYTAEITTTTTTTTTTLTVEAVSETDKKNMARPRSVWMDTRSYWTPRTKNRSSTMTCNEKKQDETITTTASRQSPPPPPPPPPPPQQQQQQQHWTFDEMRQDLAAHLHPAVLPLLQHEYFYNINKSNTKKEKASTFFGDDSSSSNDDSSKDDDDDSSSSLGFSFAPSRRRHPKTNHQSSTTKAITIPGLHGGDLSSSKQNHHHHHHHDNKADGDAEAEARIQTLMKTLQTPHPFFIVVYNYQDDSPSNNHSTATTMHNNAIHNEDDPVVGATAAALHVLQHHLEQLYQRPRLLAYRQQHLE